MAMEAEMARLAGEYSAAFGSSNDLERAYAVMREAFTLAKLDMESYFSHNIGVARIMLSLGMDKNTVLAALLHNVEEHGIEGKLIEKEFGREVYGAIDSKTRFEKALAINPEEMEIATKKMMVMLTTNPNVVIMQLAEALDKLRKIEHVPEEKKKEFLTQVREVYAPLAHKLNIYSINGEMNDLTFRNEHPKLYDEIEKSMRLATSRGALEMEGARHKVEDALQNAGIKASVVGRAKTVYSAYAKMRSKNIGIGQIYDLLALRIVTETEKDCYEILGIVHTLWKPIPGEFDDYIAKPKPNGYKSLHTSVYLESDVPVEVQIRTKEMQDFAEFGIASHWAYKGEKKDTKHDRKIEWIKQVLDWQRGAGREAEIDIFGKEIFALSPKGQVIELPEGATIIDFAYAIHSDIGNKCIGGKINGVIAALNTQIRSGDIIEIITSGKQKPKAGWLSFAKSGKAQQKIRAKLSIGKLGRGQGKPGHVGRFTMTTADRRARLAKCCNPLPGDAIIGLRTTKRKISIHRIDCEGAQKSHSEKVPVAWDKGATAYEATIEVVAKDRLGILRDILGVFTDDGIYVKSANAKSSASNTAMCIFGVRLKNSDQYEKIREKIGKVGGVLEVRRE